jgi:hypothetical protein
VNVKVRVFPVEPDGAVPGLTISVPVPSPGLAIVGEASPAVIPKLNRIAAPKRATRDEVTSSLDFLGHAAGFPGAAARTPGQLAVVVSATAMGPSQPGRPRVGGMGP